MIYILKERIHHYLTLSRQGESCMKSFEKIPHIDLAPIFTHTDTGLLSVADQVRQIYTNVGFAYLINHGISEDLVQATFQAAKDFHNLPLNKKLKIRQNKFFRGYMPRSTSRFELSTLEKANKPNQSEAFIIANEVSEESEDFKLEQNLAGPNQWPEDMPEFKETITTYYKSMQALAKRMVQVFAMAFGLSPDALDNYFREPTIFLRLQYYPEQPDIIPEDQYGIAPHTDYGFLTLLAQDTIGGLQVKNQEGEWIDVPPEPGSFILNSGDMIKWMTNDNFISTPHRVINRSGKKRYAIPFFFEPSMHAQIAPLDIFKDVDNPARYPRIEYADHLMTRIKSNYSIGA
ncbi:isopenicillin N synthase family oxygenase [Photorhabdus luminescens]|nr:isopenicillin N synthase family oxygenase [Photorhabdus luminescens]PQQ31850.1 isopenicillin N synthase family oxygenase [Photorhabdus luminescens]PQQ40838.1 isopenicillin N synthase family oxygenase [Photorhabdus luminescens]